jgi:hypothetical protein
VIRRDYDETNVTEYVQQDFHPGWHGRTSSDILPTADAFVPALGDDAGCLIA